MNEKPSQCPDCGEDGEEVYENDYGPTGEAIFVCGNCGFCFSVLEGEVIPIHDT